MKCQDIMKRNPQCLAPRDDAQLAARKMRDANVGFLPICDAQGKVQGTLTDRDLTLRLIAESKPVSTPVSELMTKETVSCRPTDDVTRATELMRQNHVSRILCCENGGKLIGVISLSDIAQKVDEHDVAETVRVVTEREAHP